MLPCWGPHGIVQCSVYVPAFCGVNVMVLVDPGVIVVAGIPSSLDSMPCTPLVPTNLSVTGWPALTVMVDGANAVVAVIVTVCGASAADAETGTAMLSVAPSARADKAETMRVMRKIYGAVMNAS